MTHRTRTHHAIPEAVSGYPLDAAWYAVVPETEDRVNRVANPSVETNTTGYTAIGGSIARSTTKQRRGAYSLAVTLTATNDGARYDTVATVAGESLMWSFDIWAPGGIPLIAFWATTGGVLVGTAIRFKGAGDWQRIQVPYHETATTTRRLYVIKNLSARTGTLYLDGMMVVDAIAEFKYFDGDRVGFVFNQVDFYWNGTPHGSTSTMRAHTRAGGRVVSLASLGFTLMGMLGLGLGTPANIAIPLALGGGEHYQRTLGGARSFDLVGVLQARSGYELDRLHAGLSAALDVRRQPVTQPLLLQYEPVNECGDVIGKRVEIKCSLESGLEGRRDNDYMEQLDLRFRIHLPVMGALDGTEGAALDVRDTITDAAYIVRRDREGIWSALQTGLNFPVHVSLWLPDGRLLVGGGFINAGGVANADYLAVYDPTTNTFAALNATPLSAEVFDLLLLPNGNVLVGGNFLNAGGDANGDYLCLLTIATGAFSALNATPLNGVVYTLALLPTGDVALGGAFLNAGGDALADQLARMSGTTFAYSSFTAVALGNVVRDLEVGADNNLYLGGDFLNAGGVAEADFLAVLKQSESYDTFRSIITPAGAAAGGVLSAAVLVLRKLSNGDLFVGGNFLNVYTDSDWDYALIYNGSEYRLVIEKIDAPVSAASESIPGVYLFGGLFTSVGGVALYDRMAQVSGGTIVPLDIDLPGTPQVESIATRPEGDIVIGFGTTGTGYTSGTTEVTNSGTAPTKPVVVISHPTTATLTAPLYSIRNLTTRQIVSFNLTLLIGETVTLDFARRTFTSNIRGNLAGTILPGSNFDSFSLVPGPNRINIFSSLASGSLPDAYAYWTPGYAELADASR